jgi:hypothetical protein
MSIPDLRETFFQLIESERLDTQDMWGVDFERAMTAGDWRVALLKLIGNNDLSVQILISLSAVAMAAYEQHELNGGFPPRSFQTKVELTKEDMEAAMKSYVKDKTGLDIVAAEAEVVFKFGDDGKINAQVYVNGVK